MERANGHHDLYALAGGAAFAVCAMPLESRLDIARIIFFLRGISFQNDGLESRLLGLGLRVALGRSAMQWHALWAHTVRWIVLSTAVPQQSLSDRTRRCGRSLSALSCGQSCRRSATRRQPEVDR